MSRWWWWIIGCAFLFFLILKKFDELSSVGNLIALISLAFTVGVFLYQRAPGRRPTTIGGVADELAAVVRGQWDDEAEVRRLNDPYPLPVSWKAAPAELFDSWESLEVAARTWAGGARPDPSGWASSPAGLQGTNAELADVVSKRVPTGRLVVLGEPGAGKTMLLVRLVLDLLACREAGGPVPVLVSLASWNPEEQDLLSWLRHTLTTDNPWLRRPAPDRIISVTCVDALFEKGLILPILDGLDEIPDKGRASAIRRINGFLRPGVRLVLSSRVDEYRTALQPPGKVGETLRNGTGVVLEDLDAEATKVYLERDAGGEVGIKRWEPVTAVLGTDHRVAVALRTPLMVGLARTIYNPRDGELAKDLPPPADLCELEDVERHLFDGFIPAAYREHPDKAKRCPWKTTDAKRWLVYLACHLGDPSVGDGARSVKRKAGRAMPTGPAIAAEAAPRLVDRPLSRCSSASQADTAAADAVQGHHVERVVVAEPVLEPDRELAQDPGGEPDHQRAEHVDVAARRGTTERRGTTDLAWWELHMAVAPWFIGTLAAVVPGLAIGLAAAYGETTHGEPLGIGLGVGLMIGLVGTVLVRRVKNLIGGAVVGIAWGGTSAVLGAFLGGLLGAAIGIGKGPTGGLVGAVGVGLGVGPLGGVLGSVLGGLAGGAAVGLTAGMAPGLPAGIIDGLGGGAAAALILVLAGRQTPARGLRGLRWSPFAIAAGAVAGVGLGAAAGPAAGLVGMVAGFCLGLLGPEADLKGATSPRVVLLRDRRTFLSFSLIAGATVFAGASLAVAPIVGVAGGITVGLVFGCLQAAWGKYTIARYWLALRGHIPWRLMAFLVDAHEKRGVLRQVGAIYQFRHADLQRRLAGRS